MDLWTDVASSAGQADDDPGTDGRTDVMVASVGQALSGRGGERAEEGGRE